MFILYVRICHIEPFPFHSIYNLTDGLFNISISGVFVAPYLCRIVYCMYREYRQFFTAQSQHPTQKTGRKIDRKYTCKYDEYVVPVHFLLVLSVSIFGLERKINSSFNLNIGSIFLFSNFRVLSLFTRFSIHYLLQLNVVIFYMKYRR